MASTQQEGKLFPYTCIAFVHEQQFANLSHCADCSAVVFDKSCQQMLIGTLQLYQPNVFHQNRLSSSKFAYIDINGSTAMESIKSAANLSDSGQDFQSCFPPKESNNFCVQLYMPTVVHMVKTDSHRAGCIRRTLGLSLQFARHFIDYALHCAKKRSALPVPCGYFVADIVRLTDGCSHVPGLSEEFPSPDSAVHTHQCIVIVMSPASKQWLDYQWCYRVNDLLVKRMELDDALNWLSTLGGAYSSLGEYFSYHAECAGKISVQQLQIALELGSPPVVIRCHLYFALSLLQTGRLRPARRLIRSKYSEVLRLPVRDVQLVAMCQSLWNRLRYLHSQRRQLAPRYSTS